VRRYVDDEQLILDHEQQYHKAIPSHSWTCESVELIEYQLHELQDGYQLLDRIAMPRINMEEGGIYEDIFIVGDGDDSLKDEDSGAGHCRNVGAVVGVFPADSAILFVETDTILHLQWFTLGICNPSVKVLLSNSA
jgi:hypothetical protein